MIAILTLLATVVASVTVSHRRSADRLIQAAQLDNLADSAIRLSLLRMMTPASSPDQRPISLIESIQLLGATAEVTLERESARIDLNSADEELLFALFAANGWDDERARGMTSRILDWKDADDVPRGHGGAERREYVDAGLRYGPRNGPFESVDEIRQVLGAEDIPAALFAALTVYTHLRAPPEALANAAVRQALSLADKRRLGGRGWISSSEAPGDKPLDINPSPVAPQSFIGEIVRVRACAGIQSFKRCRLAVVRLTGNDATPLQVFAWDTNISE